MSEDTQFAVDISGLSRSFQGTAALRDVTLQVPRGTVFGLVGLNGAGKTTLIQHILGSMRALHGHVKVLGQDPCEHPETLLARIGYMSEEDALPHWMRVRDLLEFCRRVYPTWSDEYAAELCELFSLSHNKRLGDFSKGGRARAALLAAIAHRPELLILDEPSSGLDPIARADILEAIIRTVSDEGRTVLFSSHLLDEIDRVCDTLAVIHEGRVLETIAPDQVSERYLECVFATHDVAAAVPHVPLGFGAVRRGNEWSVIVDQEESPADPEWDIEATAGEPWQFVRRRSVTLDRWFAARVRAPSQSVVIRAEGGVEHV